MKVHGRGLGFVLAASACGRAPRGDVSAGQASLGLPPGHTAPSSSRQPGGGRCLLGSEEQRLVERLQGGRSLLRTVCTRAAPGAHVSSSERNPHGPVVALNA